MTSSLRARRRPLRVARPLADAPDRELEVRERVRVRQAQVPLAGRTEARAREDGHTGLLEDALRDARAVAQAEAGHVRERVERAVRDPTGDAVDRVQARDDRVAALAERGEHHVKL